MIKLFAILLSSALVSGCIHRSTLTRPDDANKKYTFEYCGGQMWGYRKKLIDNGSVYLGVYLENHVNVAGKETSVANFVIAGKSELDFSFDEVKFEIEVNGQKRTRSESLWIAKDGKSIGDKYSGNEYDWKFKEGTTWTVRKKRYGLGMLALGEPFDVTLPVYANKEINSNKFKVEFDKENVRELFVFDKFILTELTADKMGTATISITTPAFTLNNQRFPGERYVFNLDRDKIADKIKNGTSPCASMEQVFRFGRKDGLNPLNWMGPYLID